MYPVRQDVQSRYADIKGTSVYGKTGQYSAGSASGSFIPRNFELESYRATRAQKQIITDLDTRIEALTAQMETYVMQGNEELADEAFTKKEQAERDLIKAKSALMTMQENEDKMKAQRQQTRELLLRGTLADNMEAEVMKISNDEISELANKEQTIQSEIIARNALILTMDNNAAKHAEAVNKAAEEAKNSSAALSTRERRMKAMEKQQDMKRVQSTSESSSKTEIQREIERAREEFNKKISNKTQVKV